MITDKKPHIERKQTDESLQQEREDADHVLAKKVKHTQNKADGIVERARDKADDVLDAAREKEDEKLNPDGLGEGAPNAVEREAVAQERDEEDVVLEKESATEDDTLRREREEEARILATQLPSERKKTDANLRAEREFSDSAVVQRDDIMGMIGQDLNNFADSIATHAKCLAMQASDSDEGRRTLAGTDSIERCVVHMHALIGELLDVASIDRGELALQSKPGDVATMISEAITRFSQAAQEKGLSLAFATDGQMLSGVFDKERMLQVLGSLIANAMRFTPSGGAITLKSALVKNELRVSVLDTGEGIAAGMREAMFKRFVPAGGIDHRRLVLGLYISKCIVEVQGGRIWAEGNPVGTGTAIHFTIPVPKDPHEIHLIPPIPKKNTRSTMERRRHRRENSSKQMRKNDR